MLVRDIMRSDVVKLKRSDAVAIAHELMQLVRIRYLPVTDDAGERVVGVVSHRDLVRCSLPRPCEERESVPEVDEPEVAAAMSPEVVSITPDASVSSAARLMNDRRVGCLPVVDGGKLVGIVTESEFVKLVSCLEAEEAATWLL